MLNKSDYFSKKTQKGRKRASSFEYVVYIYDMHHYHMKNNWYYRLMANIYVFCQKFSFHNILKLLVGYKTPAVEEAVLKGRSRKFKKKDSLVTGEVFNGGLYNDDHEGISDQTGIQFDQERDSSLFFNKEFAPSVTYFSRNRIFREWLYGLRTSEMLFTNENSRGWSLWIPRLQARWFAMSRRRRDFFHSKLPNKDTWYTSYWKLPWQPYSQPISMWNPRRTCEEFIRPSDFLIDMSLFHLRMSMFILSRELELFIDVVDKQKIPEYVTPLDLRFFFWTFKGLKIRLVNRLRLMFFFTPKKFHDFFMEYGINPRKIAVYILTLPLKIFRKFYNYFYNNPIEKAREKREKSVRYKILDRNLKVVEEDNRQINNKKKK